MDNLVTVVRGGPMVATVLEMVSSRGWEGGASNPECASKNCYASFQKKTIKSS